MVSRFNALTPPHWKSLAIVKHRNAYRLEFFMTKIRLTKLDLAAMKLPATTKTEGISQATALALGEEIEAWILAQEGQVPKKAK